MYRVGQWLIGMFVVIVWVVAGFTYAHIIPNYHAIDSSNPRSAPLLWQLYEPEQASDGTRYRWSQPHASIVWTGLNYADMLIATMSLADTGAPVDAQIVDYAVSITGHRVVSLLLPHTAWNGTQVIDIVAPPFQPAQEERQLGVRLLAIGIASTATALTVPLISVISTVWLACMLMLSVRLLWRSWWWLGGIIAPLITVVMAGLDPLYAADWVSGLALVSSVIPVFVYGARRWLPGGLVAVTSAVYVMRLWGVMYPLFAGHDYPIHLRRVFQFSEGIWSLTANPYEFGRRTSVILPLYYRLADLLSHVLGNHLAMHALIITSETALGIAVWLVLRRIGVDARVALLASVLTLAWPISSAVLWWSFMQQITAHVFTILVAYATIRRDQRGAYLAMLFLAIVATMHIGEMMVAALWYALLRLSEPDIGQPAWWRRSVPVIVLVPILLPLYLPFIQNLTNGNGGSLINPDLSDVVPRMITAVTVAWQPLPILAAPVVIGAAVLALKRTGWTWLGVGLTFWVVELLTQAQVRYLYTITPLFTAGLAVVLTPLWRKGYAGRMFVLCIIGFVAWVSIALWVDGVMGWQKPRIDGLTH